MSQTPSSAVDHTLANAKNNTIDERVDKGNKRLNAVSTAERVLKKGDLVRILDSTPTKPKLKNHIGNLGRIARSIPVEDATAPHPFLYDIDFILGGKVNGVERCDLQYTTAEGEGMIGNTKRKRKPNTSFAPSPVIKEKKSKKSTPPKKQKKNTAKKTQVTKSGGNKRPSTSSAAKTKSKKNKSSKSDSSKAENLPPSTTVNLYERHRREFERCITRLEKADTFHWFMGDVPPEDDESDTSDRDSLEKPGNVQQEGNEIPSINTECVIKRESQLVNSDTVQTPAEALSTPVPMPAPLSAIIKKSKGKEFSIRSPNQAPYNFEILRKRIKKGRYVLDQEALENKERQSMVKAYVKSLGNTTKEDRSKVSKAKAKFKVLHPKAVNWDLFRQDVIGMCETATRRKMECDDGSSGTISYACKKVKEVMEQIYEKTGRRQPHEILVANSRHRYATAIEAFSNNEAAVQGRWRKEAFPYRRYERLKTDAICAGLTELDERIALYELKTNMKDSFVGLSYMFDDNEKSEAWMKSILNEKGDSKKQRKIASALASDNGVIKAQVEATIQSLLIAVQDRVMTDLKVLEQPELRNASWMTESQDMSDGTLSRSVHNNASAPEIVEQPVWGIDCYTRRNVSISLEATIDSDTALVFIEKWLLPAINACPVEIAHNISNAARILEGLPFESDPSLDLSSTSMKQWGESLLGKALLNKIAESGPAWLKLAAHVFRKAYESLGSDFFRVHPKGHGSIVLCPKLKANTLVTFYRGEVYPSWRWGEKMDAIASIQEKKGLKPVLPDFFNMALERPMKDPRGYGLLFCDASRKSGYGSMLSHSCEPSCEVRVAAVNGKLTLAMTTLREMTIGDELTFDYNAVTESLNEYQSAVCLCGHGRCRGSFLHFATADCYQQVLNRNSPVAVRIANLIKGCMKKVMSEDDQDVLKRHGFQTAAFGAVSVNRRRAKRSTVDEVDLDSMDFVPIWLQTYVADTLRYIEYERRALPIALICNQLYPEDQAKSGDSNRSAEVAKPIEEEGDDKPIKGAKPEPPFFYYSRTQKSHFVSLLMKDTQQQNLIGIELKREVQKLASTHWKALSANEKEGWKRKAREEWVKNGGMEKARLSRLLKVKSKTKDKKCGIKEKKKSEKTTKDNHKAEKNDEDQTAERKITFQAADAEGISAMEQRIQQLTQTLSRVGRVLDRHREEKIRRNSDQLPSFGDVNTSTPAIQKLVHSPLSIMPDEHIIAWVWNHEKGIVKVLLKFIAVETSASPELKKAVTATALKYSELKKFGHPWLVNYVPSTGAMSPAEGRKRLNEALLKLRSVILNGIDEMASAIKKHKAFNRKVAAQKKKTENEEREIRAVMNDLIKVVECRVSEIPESSNEIVDDIKMKEASPDDNVSETWMQSFNKRFKLEKVADILLMYACTSTFFALKPYQPLQSSTVEVYARELGNAVPKSAIDIPNIDMPFGAKDGTIGGLSSSTFTRKMDTDGTGTNSKKPRCLLCEPDDIIAEVAVNYQGDYVLSQLLQWYNAGIGQNPGLPDLLGCVMLPTLEHVWSIDGTLGKSSRTDRPTGYKSIIRPRLIDWFKDPLKRGSPWPDDLRRAYVEKVDDKPMADASKLWMPIGSPVLDFLVTGDDLNINTILQEMGSNNFDDVAVDSSGMLSSVDHGRPALAVSNWVQCENPDCLKWRKLPWHVDIDTLAEKFYCKDNIWNPQSASCDAPEDEWDERADGLVDADGSAPIAVPQETISDNSEPDEDEIDHSLLPTDFKFGARYDVLHTGKSKWTVGVVVKIRDESGRKEVKFHFLNHNVKYDEWIRVPSSRVVPLYSKTEEPTKRKEKKKHQSLTSCREGSRRNEDQNLDPNANEGDQDSKKADFELMFQDKETGQNATKTTICRPATVSDESTPIHSPSNKSDALGQNVLSPIVSKNAQAQEAEDSLMQSSNGFESDSLANKKSREGLKRLIKKKSKLLEESEDDHSFSAIDYSDEEVLKPKSSKKKTKRQIPRKKLQTNESDSPSGNANRIPKKNMSTFKPLIPRKRPQEDTDVEGKASTNEESSVPRKALTMQVQGLTSLMKSESERSNHAENSRAKNESKARGHDQKKDESKQRVLISKNGRNESDSSSNIRYSSIDHDSRARSFEESRGSTVEKATRRRPIIENRTGEDHDKVHKNGDIGRPQSRPQNDDYHDNPKVPGPVGRNESFKDEERKDRARWRSEETYFRDYDREHSKDYDQDGPRGYGRDYESHPRSTENLNHGRGSDRDREYRRDNYDCNYGRSSSQGYDRDYNRRYDGSYSQEYDDATKYSYERENNRNDDRGSRGQRNDQGYDRGEGRAYRRRYDDDDYRYDHGDYVRRYERDFNRDDGRDHRRNEIDYDRDNGREYRRQYERPHDREKHRDHDRHSDRDNDRACNRDRNRDWSRDRELSHAEDYNNRCYETQRSSRSAPGRSNSPNSGRYTSRY